MQVSYTDKEIIQGIKGGDRRVEEEFYRANYPMIREMVRKRDSYDRFDPQDIYQEGVATIFVKVREGKLDGLNAKLSTYLYSVCYRTLMYRMRQRKNINDPINEETLNIEQDGVDSEDLQMQVEIIGLIKDLKSPCNGIINDRYLKNRDYDFIAQEYGYKNANSAKKKSHLCMQELRAKAVEVREKFL